MIKQDDVADVMNAINRALDDLHYEAVAYDNTGSYLKVLIEPQLGWESEEDDD